GGGAGGDLRGARQSLRVARSGDRRDRPAGVDLADALVVAVGDVDVALGVDGHAVGLVEDRRRGRAAVAVGPGGGGAVLERPVGPARPAAACLTVGTLGSSWGMRPGGLGIPRNCAARGRADALVISAAGTAEPAVGTARSCRVALLHRPS